MGCPQFQGLGFGVLGFRVSGVGGCSQGPKPGLFDNDLGLV